MQIVAVNCGNWNTKGKSAKGELLFKTRINQNGDATRYIIFDGEKIEVGEGEADIDNLKNKSLVNKLCTLYAVAELSTEYEIILVTCLPINQFKNKSLRNEYEKFLLGEHHIVTSSGVKSFRILKNIVYMEGAAPVLSNLEYFSDELITVVDIGGYNVNVAQFLDCRIVKGTEDDFDMGMYKIKSDIITELNKDLNAHIKEHELTHIIKHPSIDQCQIIDKHIHKFIDTLRFNLKKKGYNLGINKFFFTGGGSQELESYIIQRFDNCQIGNIFDTVRGLYEVGVKKCDSV